MNEEITISGRTAPGKDFVRLFHALAEKQKETEAAWIAFLRAQDVKAAHPDDGWVDRALNRVILCYPYFIDPALKPDDLIVLGCPDKYRYVRIIGIQKSILFYDMVYYEFIELPTNEQNILRSLG